jgi:hypothetical protein
MKLFRPWREKKKKKNGVQFYAVCHVSLNL